MKDVVCGMDVLEDSKFHSEYHHKPYYFCSEQCKIKFDTAPKTYLYTNEKTNTEPCHDSSCDMKFSITQYTCPMHPEIIKNEPGDCPICGMSLEPLVATKEEENSELKSMTQRFWFSLFISTSSFYVSNDSRYDAINVTSNNLYENIILDRVFFGYTSSTLEWMAIFHKSL